MTMNEMILGRKVREIRGMESFAEHNSSVRSRCEQNTFAVYEKPNSVASMIVDTCEEYAR